MALPLALATAGRALFSKQVLTIGAAGLSALGLSSIFGSKKGGSETQTATLQPASTATNYPVLNLTENVTENNTQNDYYSIVNSPDSSIYASKKLSSSAESSGGIKSASVADSNAKSVADMEASGEEGLTEQTIITAAVIAGACFILGEVVD